MSIPTEDIIREISGMNGDISFNFGAVRCLTANAFADDVKRNKEAGMNDRISKPLDAQKIISVLSRYIGK